jgi:hypothetical protein
MYARIESVPSTGHHRLRPRLVVGGLAAVLAAGVIAGFLAAGLGAHGPSTVVSRAPAATVYAPSTGVYGDRDSRLPIATGATISPTGDLCDRNSCGALVTGSDVSALNLGNAARVTALQGMARVDWSAAAGDASSVRDSRPPLAPFNLR